MAPTNYLIGGYECIDVIYALGLNFTLGNVIKYIWRAGRTYKRRLEDLEKARFYLNEEIRHAGGDDWNPQHVHHIDIIADPQDPRYDSIDPIPYIEGA